jgi:indolepyruvate ferredoxin oxidoreductase alpha subunit
MKHVGMNVCADAFVNSAITGVNGGIVVLAADDPSMHSSQNEQDSRFYGKFAMIPIFEPTTQQEAYDMMPKAFELSESLKLPVLLRVVTRLAHSRAAVEIGEIAPVNEFNPERNPSNWVLLPVNARRRYKSLIEKQSDMEAASKSSQFNSIELGNSGNGDKAPLGIVACGIAYNYVKESGFSAPIFKLSQYPISQDIFARFAEQCERIIVCEDGQPVVEELVRAAVPDGVVVNGRLDGVLPRTGELDPDNVARALGVECSKSHTAAENVVPRPPALCQGCGHRDVYEALKIVAAEYPESRIFGDIGCYTLGALPPYRSLDSCVDMGASITMAKGAADAGLYPAIAVIGDSTFTHSGMTGLLDAVNDNSPITIIISDNLTTAMTGGQDSAGTNKFETICIALGVEKEHVRVVVPLAKNMEEITNILREEIEYKGVSVIIPRRECIQTLSRKARVKSASK